jgi:hypothetical protein
MGSELDAGRRSDRAVFENTISSEAPVALTNADADAVLRVLNEARLALGARFGIDVEQDHDDLPEDSRQVLDYLGWIQEELTVELMRAL